MLQGKLMDLVPSVVVWLSKGKGIERRLHSTAYSARLERAEGCIIGGTKVADALRAVVCPYLGRRGDLRPGAVGRQLQETSKFVVADRWCLYFARSSAEASTS